LSINIIDIAKRANVSKSTVSRVLNGQPHVSKKTRETIFRIIEELDFQPNPYARSIVSGKTKIVGLLIPNLKSPFYIEIMEGIVDEVGRNDYGLLIYKSEDKDEKILKKVFHKGRTDGIIAITPRFHEQSFVDAFKDDQPFVLINHRNTQINTPFVCFNNFKGGYMAAKFLLDLGHRDIACFAGRISSQSTKDRFEGFKKALKEADVNLNESRIRIKGMHFEESISNIIVEWSRENKMPTAIFAYNDLTAFEIIEVLKELGFSVPGDVSVIGFDNTEMSRHFHPPLTTINQSMKKIGESGANMLLSLIQGVTLKKNKITIEPEVIIRGSCDKPS